MATLANQVHCLRLHWLSIGLLVLATSWANGQSQEPSIQSLRQLLDKEGEVFVAVDRYYEKLKRTCTVEDLFRNQLSVNGELVTIRFLNHTESPCEQSFLHSEADFTFLLNDIDPARLLSVQKQYPLGNGTLSDGQAAWFEIHLFTRQNQPLIQRKDRSDQAVEMSTTVRLLFKSQEGARQALAVLRSMVK